MRKYDSKNKRNIGIIIGICLVVAVIFSYFLLKEIKLSKIKYELEPNTIVFDIDKNTILLDEIGTIKKKWNKKYYLNYKEKDHQIGTHVIAFNNKDVTLDLYGEFYEINRNSKIDITDEETSLNNLAISRFYKISDRKYLIIDSNIKSEDGTLETSNYLIVELDKIGNALLYNNSLNLKTFKETKIITSSYTFDIANELLIFDGETIDLKKILGTTNEYKEKEEDKDKNNGDSTGNGGTGNGGDGNNAGNGGTGGGNGGAGTGNNNGGAGGGAGNGGINTDEDGTDISDDDIIDQTSTTSVIKITPNMSSIDIDYVIYDKQGKYITTFVEVKSDNDNKTIHLSKNTTNTRLTNLSPGTIYDLTFKYTYMDNGVLKEEIFASHKVKTLLPNITIKIDKVTSKKIDYIINIDAYSISSATLRLYVDGVKQEREISINGNGKITGTFDLRDITLLNNSLVELSLENIYINNIIYDKKVSETYKRNEKLPEVPELPEEGGDNNEEKPS